MDECVFQFKQFSVRHSDSAMKVGTDGVLLGSWCDCRNAGRVLDIGCGTGLISLMIAQRNSRAHIEAVEIDGIAAKEAMMNFKNSKWHDRLSVENCDILGFYSIEKYDLIVSNPPFFMTGNVAPDSRRSLARHCGRLSFANLFNKVSELLADDGLFSMIAPVDSKEEVEFCAGESDFWICRRTMIRTSPRKTYRRCLWEFSKTPAEVTDSSITISDGGAYSQEFVGLTRDFYLKM